MEEEKNGDISYRLRRIGAPATIEDVADVFVLKKNTTFIGRAKSKVDFFIDSSKNKALISRVHARISKCQGDLFKIYDVSLNGTFLDDVKIANEAFLTPGNVVIFGHVQGSCLEAGNSYKQFNSEFEFVFERFDNRNGEALTHIDYTSRKQETPGALMILPAERCCLRQRVLTFDNSQNNDYKTLQDIASTAVSSFTKQNEGDEDLPAFQYTSILPHSVREKKRKRSKQESQRTDIDKTFKGRKQVDQKGIDLDTCSASKCRRPEDRIISWVQCDDCDDWYHVKCCGLSMKLVKVKNSKFHCGCS